MFLGIDIGTSSTKAVLLDGEGVVIDQSEATIGISRPRPLWSEQDPSEWWEAVNEAVLGLDANKRRDVLAVGLSGHMHGATLLDASLEPLRPAILWNDGRSYEECSALQAREPGFLSRAGNLVMPGFTAPKLEWVRLNEPDIFAKIHKVLLPKDYIRLKMTGVLASDVSDSAGTLWMDVANRTWDPKLLEACGLSSDAMPDLFEGTEVTGSLLRAVADTWGMRTVDVVGGGGDNAAGAVGAGVIDEAQALMSLGTSGVIFAPTTTFLTAPRRAVHAFCHALPERWHVMSVMLSAASCLEWGRRVVGLPSPAALISAAEQAAQFSQQEVFLPYLSGERTPHNDPHARGVLYGAGHETSIPRVAQAILEGVAFGIADGLEALEDTGVSVPAVSVIGGGSRSAYWGRILAAALQRPLIYREASDAGAAVGAARLARYSQFGGSWDRAFPAPNILSTIEPNQNDTESMAPTRRAFKNVYRALKDSFSGDDDVE